VEPTPRMTISVAGVFKDVCGPSSGAVAVSAASVQSLFCQPFLSRRPLCLKAQSDFVVLSAVPQIGGVGIIMALGVQKK